MQNPVSMPLITSQQWKLWFLAVMVAIVAALIFAQESISAYFAIDPTFALLGGVAFGLFTFVVGCLIICCPGCGLKLLWHGLSKKSVGKWLSWLLDLEECPRCGCTHSNGRKRPRE